MLTRKEGMEFAQVALILALVVVVAIAALATLGSKIGNILSKVANAI